MFESGDVRILSTLGRAELIALWRRSIKSPPPHWKSTDLFRRALAFELQSAVSNTKLSVAAKRKLARLAASDRANSKTRTSTLTLQPGSMLVRDWRGERFEVRVLAGGFEWRGDTFSNLSSVARAITGVRRSGPAFFGLKRS